jgi:hypothetical protein
MMANPTGMDGVLRMTVIALTGIVLGAVLMALMVVVPWHSGFHHLSREG